jgi:hypothetical protein
VACCLVSINNGWDRSAVDHADWTRCAASIAVPFPGGLNSSHHFKNPTTCVRQPLNSGVAAVNRENLAILNPMSKPIRQFARHDQSALV